MPGLRPVCVLRGQAVAGADPTTLAFMPQATAEVAKGFNNDDDDENDCVVPRQILAVGDLFGTVTFWNLVTRRPVVAFQPTPSAAQPQSTQGALYRNPAIMTVAFLTPQVLLTQARNRQVHLWDCEALLRSGTAAEVGLDDAKLTSTVVPQFGFCNVGWVPAGDAGQGWLLLPEDGDDKCLSVQHIVISRDGPTLAATAAPVHRLALQTSQKLGMSMSIVVPAPALACAGVPSATAVLGFESGHIILLGLQTNTTALSVAATRVIRAFADPIVAIAASVLPATVSVLCYGTSATGALQCYDVTLGDNEAAAALKWEDKIPVGANSATVRFTDGRVLMLGGWDGTLRLYDATAGGRIGLVSAHESGVTSVAFGGVKGDVIACASSDRTISIWNLSSD